jgi:L-lactate dehydrogenase (cytochrome)
MERLIDRAKNVNCSALVLTVDLQILGQRHADIRNGLGAPPDINLDTISQFITRPEWCLRMLGAKSWTFGNIVGHVQGVENLGKLGSWIADQFDPSLSWDDVSWVRDRWQGKIILKGIMDPEDAVQACNRGVDAIVVSNHGGRQLDGTVSSISMLPKIVDAVHDRNTEVHIDSGIRSGQDVLRAVALGANAAYIGRPYLYGLGAYVTIDSVAVSLFENHQSRITNRHDITLLISLT